MREQTELLTVREAAARLQLSVPGLSYVLIRACVVPARRIDRSLRLNERALASFIEAGGQGWPGGWRKRPRGAKRPSRAGARAAGTVSAPTYGAQRPARAHSSRCPAARKPAGGEVIRC